MERNHQIVTFRKIREQIYMDWSTQRMTFQSKMLRAIIQLPIFSPNTALVTLILSQSKVDDIYLLFSVLSSIFLFFSFIRLDSCNTIHQDFTVIISWEGCPMASHKHLQNILKEKDNREFSKVYVIPNTVNVISLYIKESTIKIQFTFCAHDTSSKHLMHQNLQRNPSNPYFYLETFSSSPKNQKNRFSYYRVSHKKQEIINLQYQEENELAY